MDEKFDRFCCGKELIYQPHRNGFIAFCTICGKWHFVSFKKVEEINNKTKIQEIISSFLTKN